MRTTIDRAIGALIEDRDRKICARPIFWRGSGEALTLHAGNLYRIAPGLEPLDGPPVHLDAAAIVAKWETLEIAAVVAEPSAPAKVRRPPRARPAGEKRQRRGKRGRPSADDLRGELPEGERDAWVGVSEAAALAGASRDRIRRALVTGQLEGRSVRGVMLVSAAGARAFATAPAATPAPAPAETSAAADDQPAPADSAEVYS